MRKSMVLAAGIALAMAARSAGGAVIADYQDDFAYPAPPSGWSYLWNANGPIGNASNYVSLVADSATVQRYETQNQTPDAFPDADPGASASATATTLVPGQGSAEDSADIERYVIAAYTISAADAANGNQLTLDGYSFSVPLTSEDGVTARVYKNDTLLVNRDLFPGLVFDVNTPAPNGGPIPLGEFAEGDTLYVAIGADGIAAEPPIGNGGNDNGDVLTVDYSLVLIPEPTGVAPLAIGTLALLARRRSRRRPQ